MTMDTNGIIISRNQRRSKFAPESAAFLIVDMQEYFRGIASPIIPNLVELLHAWRQSGLPVIFTRHAHESAEKDAGMLANWWGDLIIDGTPDAEILSELAPHAADKIVHKNRYSAFFQTDLNAHLQHLGIRQLIIAGVMTNLCCETTARDAFVHDYEVFFLVDGTATLSDHYHRATLLNLSFGFAHLKTCYDIKKMLKEERTSK